jgi:hypothetical protein
MYFVEDIQVDSLEVENLVVADKMEVNYLVAAAHLNLSYINDIELLVRTNKQYINLDNWNWGLSFFSCS